MAVTYSNAHLLIRAGGHFGSPTVPSDHWSIGMRFGLTAADVPYSPSALTTFVAAAKVQFAAFHAHANAFVGLNTYLTWVTGARIGTDGHYDPESQDTVREDFGAVGGAGTMTQAWSTALVISLRTIRPRGVGSNGRIYYPACSAVPLGSSGRITDANVMARLTAFKTLVDSLNTAANTYVAGAGLLVVSGKPPGRNERVTDIRADGRLDNIERRENDVPSTYQVLSIA